MTFRIITIVFVTMLFNCSIIGAANKKNDIKKRPAILFSGIYLEGWYYNPSYRTIKKLDELGFEVNHCAFDKLNAKLLKKYNVLVLLGVENSPSTDKVSANFYKNRKVIKDFLANGGGVLFFPFYQHRKTEFISSMKFGAGYGISLSWSGLKDPQTMLCSTSQDITFAWTKNVIKNSLTSGVNGIWYPISTPGELNSQTVRNHTIPMKLSNDWQVLVKTSETTVAKAVLSSIREIDQSSFSSKGPFALLAVNNKVKPGRLAVCSISPFFSFIDGYNPIFEGIMMAGAYKGRKSSMERLLVNLLRYLAEPSMKQGRIGTKTPQKLLNNPALTNECPFYNWPMKKAEDALLRLTGKKKPKQLFKGIVGAQSKLSSGKGKIADFVSKAKNAGFDFIVFTENFAKLTREEFEQLKSECARFSDKDFAAIPGFVINDMYGNNYFAFGDFSYPAESVLTPDKTRLGFDGTGKIDERHNHFARILLSWIYNSNSLKMTIGPYDFKNNTVPFYDFRNYNSMGIITQQGGKIVDLAIDKYLSSQKDARNLRPFAINFVNSPNEIGKSKLQTVIQAKDLKSLKKDFNKWRYLNSDLQYVTLGPKILRYDYLGYRDYHAAKSTFRWDLMRWQINFDVFSPKGLKEIRIMDGPNLFRRYLPQGAKHFSGTIETSHMQQKNLVLIAEDINGNQAVSTELFDRSHLLEDFWSSEMGNNRLTYSMQIRPDNTKFCAAPKSSVIPWPGPASWQYIPVTTSSSPHIHHWDGYKTDFTTIHIAPGISCIDGNENVNVLHNHSTRLLTSSDVMMGRAETDGRFANTNGVKNVWRTFQPIYPTKLIDVDFTNLYFNALPDTPGCILQNGRIKIKKKVSGAERVDLAVMQGSSDCRVYQIKASEQASFSGFLDQQKTNKENLCGSLKTGSYIVLGNTILFILSDNINYTFTPNKKKISLYLPVEGDLKEGASFKYSILMLDIYHKNAKKLADDFVHCFGLDNKPPAYKIITKQGKIISTQYILKLDGENFGFAGIVPKVSLPAVLPVEIKNLNPNWTVCFYNIQKKLFYPLGQYKNSAYTRLDPRNENIDFFAGHPITCNDKRIIISVVQIDTNEFIVECNNPTDETINVKLKKSPFLSELNIPTGEFSLLAGSSKKLKK